MRIREKERGDASGAERDKGTRRVGWGGEVEMTSERGGALPSS